MELFRKRQFWLITGLLTLAARSSAGYVLPPWPSILNWIFDILAPTAGLNDARSNCQPLDGVLADRLIEYVGDPALREADRRPTLLVVNSLLDPNNPPLAETNLLISQ